MTDPFRDLLKNPPQDFLDAIDNQVKSSSPEWNQPSFPFNALSAWHESKVGGVASTEPARPKGSRKWTRTWLATAAAILIAFIAGYLVANAARSPSTEPLRIASIESRQSPLRGGQFQLELAITPNRQCFASVVSLSQDRPPRVTGLNDILLSAATALPVPIPNDSEHAIVILTKSPVALYLERWSDEEQVKPFGPPDEAIVRAQLTQLLKQLRAEPFAIDSVETKSVSAAE